MARRTIECSIRALGLFLVAGLVFGLTACGEDDGGGQAGDTVTLEAGSAVDGPFGTKFRAQTESIDEPLEVEVAREVAPVEDVELPDGYETRGQAFRLTPERTVTTESDRPLLIGLPIPEDANTDNLAVAALMRPDEYRVKFGEEGRPDGYEPQQLWSFQEAYIAQGQVATTLPYLDAEQGRLLQVVEAPELRSFDGTEMQAMSHSDENFAGNCVGGFDGAPESCGTSEEQAAATDLRDVFHDIQELGFTDPALNRRVNVVPQLFNSDLGFGAYVMRLRPCSETEPGVTGMYFWASDRSWTCIDNGGYSTDETNTLRHEFFHASQYGYQAMRRDEGTGELFLIEGQAVASENSFPNLARDTGRPVRNLDVTLATDSDELSSGNLVEYYAQDFWLFLAEYLGEGDIEFFKQFLQNGADVDEVDTTLRDSFDTTLSGVYFEWAKNQAFESQYTVSNTELNGACVFESASVSDTETVTFTRGDGLSQNSITLDPLTSDVIEFDLQPASEPYVVSIGLESADTLRDDFKVYRNHTSPTQECIDPANPGFEAIAVNPGEPVKAYGLVSNALPDDHQEFELSASELDANASIEITNPSDGARVPEGQFVNFDSNVTATEGIDEIEWVTDNPDDYSGAGEVVGRGKSPSPGLMCPGNHTVTATLTGNMGLQDSDQVTFTIENQAPSIEFANKPIPTSIGSGDYLLLKAKATDRVCEFGPQSNGADDSLIEWSVNGTPAGSGLSVSHRVTANAGESITVSAEYTDDDGATASAGPATLNVTAPPPNGYPPNVVIEAPDMSEITTEAIYLEARVVDSEDANIPDSSIVWTVTGAKGYTVTRTGESPTISSGTGEGLFYGSMDIEVSVTDSDGNTTTKETSVQYVGPG